MKFLAKAFVLALAVTFVFATGAMAATVTSLFGDQDGFGIGVGEGETFAWNAVVPDGDGTDEMIRGLPLTWTHTYDTEGLGTLESATIEVFHANLGLGGAAQIFIGDELVGTLTDGNSGGIHARKDVFDLSPYLSLLTGTTTFTIVPNPTMQNNWYLDYAHLSIEGAGITDPVSGIIEQPMHAPIPGAVWLLGSGLVGLAGLRRKFMG